MPPFTYSETDTFRTPGTYPYYCTVHGAMMTGTITSQVGATGARHP
jgi:plastocyanin